MRPGGPLVPEDVGLSTREQSADPAHLSSLSFLLSGENHRSSLFLAKRLGGSLVRPALCRGAGPLEREPCRETGRMSGSRRALVVRDTCRRGQKRGNKEGDREINTKIIEKPTRQRQPLVTFGCVSFKIIGREPEICGNTDL